jgi:hypothetical protein
LIVYLQNASGLIPFFILSSVSPNLEPAYAP